MDNTDLQKKEVSKINKKKLRFILISLLLVFIVSFIIYYFIVSLLIDPYISQHLLYGRLINLLNFYNTGIPEGSILFIGGSHIREGIDARIMEERLNNTYQIYNLGLSDDSPLRRLAELEKIKSTKPEMVVIGLTFVELNNKSTVPDDMTLLVTDKITLDEYSKSLLNQNIQDKLSQTLIESYFYKRKFFTYALIQKIKIDILNKKSEVNISSVISNFKNPVQYYRSETKQELIKKINTNKEESLSIYLFDDKLNNKKKALIHFIEELKKDKIKVMIISMPIHPLWYQEIPNSSKDNRELFFNQSIMPLIDGYYDYTTAYDETNFIDLTHLNKKGRENISSEIAILIGKELS